MPPAPADQLFKLVFHYSPGHFEHIGLCGCMQLENWCEWIFMTKVDEFRAKNVHTLRPSLLTPSIFCAGERLRNWKIGSATNSQGLERAWTSEREFATFNGRTDLAHVLPPLIRRPLSALRREPIFFGQLEPAAKNDCRRTLFPLPGLGQPWLRCSPERRKSVSCFYLRRLSFHLVWLHEPPPVECIVVIKISEKMKRHWAENSIDDVLGAARPTMSMISRSDGISNALRNKRLLAHAVAHHRLGLRCLFMDAIDLQLNSAN